MRRILVVDDDFECRESLVALLGMLGHDAVPASSGALAIEKAIELQPEVVVMDLGLPDVDGCDVARAIQARVAARPLLIALTGWGRAEDRVRAADAGFDLFLLKPCDPSALESAVLEVTGRSPLKRTS